MQTQAACLQLKAGSQDIWTSGCLGLRQRQAPNTCQVPLGLPLPLSKRTLPVCSWGQHSEESGRFWNPASLGLGSRLLRCLALRKLSTLMFTSASKVPLAQHPPRWQAASLASAALASLFLCSFALIESKSQMTATRKKKITGLTPWPTVLTLPLHPTPRQDFGKHVAH